MFQLIHKLRSKLLSPNSVFELTLRTIYHKVAATKVYFFVQETLSKQSYRKYLSTQQNRPLHGYESFPIQPKVTFLISCSEGSLPSINRTIASLKSINGDDWEAILVVPDLKGNLFKEINNDDKYKFVLHIDENFINMVTGEYVVFCEEGDFFHTTLLVHFYQLLSEGVSADLISYDCEYHDCLIDEKKPFFKPTTLSPSLLISVNYLSRSFIHHEAIREIWEEITKKHNLISLEYEIILRLFEKGKIFHHLPTLLVSQKQLSTPFSPESCTYIEQHLTRQGLQDISFTKHPLGIRFTWESSAPPSLAIIIPSKNNARFLQTLIPALVDQPYQGEKSIYIVDNGSDDPATTRYYHEIEGHPKINIIPYPQPFNYSEAINLGVRESDSELVLLMNDDMALMDETWLDELAQWAIRPDIGVVGPKLLRKNHTIQHAGIIMGLTGFIGHIYLNAPEDYHGLFGSPDWYRNYLAVTGACQMVRREVFNEVGGYDEGYRLAFGDIDFCLRVHESGYHNVYTPFARLYHFEGSSRGYKTPVEDALKGYDSFESYLINEDPYFSPNLTYTRIPKCVLNPRTTEERRKQIQARKRFYLKKA